MKIRMQTATILLLLVAGCSGSGSSTAPVYTAPTIGAIPDQSTSANTISMAISFAVSGAGVLSFDASSDNQQVVPDSGLDVTSNGASSSLTVTPVVDTLGDAFITIAATNLAGQSASTSFMLTVVPQQLSVQQFVRTEFVQVEDGMPALINAVAFDQDAETDDFADLLAQ